MIVRPGQQDKKWANVRAALKTVWAKDRIDALAQKLDTYRTQLSLRVLLLLNSHFTLQGETLERKLDGLQSGSNQIVEVPSLTKNSLQSAIDKLREDFTINDKYHSERAPREENVAAILTMQDGNCLAITEQPCPSKPPPSPLKFTVAAWKPP